MPKKLRSPNEIIVNGVPLSDILEEHAIYIKSWGKSGVRAELKNANLDYSDLTGVILQWANLMGANLQSANLRGANLHKVGLQQANLRNAILYGTNLQWADLQGADLQWTNLQWAQLQWARLQKAKLQEADLQKTYLHETYLEGCNLHSANLSYSDLRFAYMKNAEITGIKIYATATANWNIEGIKCDYIFTDAEGKNRYPRDRDFEKGEFERLYRSIPTVEYIFEKGMNWFDPVLMNYVANKIDQEKPEFGVSLLSFDRQGLYPRATFTVSSYELTDIVISEIKSGYEKALEKAQNQIDFLQNLVQELSRQPRQQITGNVYGDAILADHEAQVKTINIGEVKINIEKIIETIEAEPAASFKEKGKGKKHVLDVLKGIISGLTVDKAPEIVEKVTELVNTLGPQIVDKIQPILDTLKSFV